MNWKRFVIASLVVYVCFEIFDFLVHGAILGSTYESMKNVWRPDMMDKMWMFYIMTLILSFLFVYIFIKGYEGKGMIEGLRYGIVIGLFMNIPAAFSQYALYPIPFNLAILWFVFGMIEFIICGLIAAAIYRPKNVQSVEKK